MRRRASRATARFVENGPADAATVAARTLDLGTGDIGVPIFADLALLETAGDTLEETTATAAAEWLFAALDDPRISVRSPIARRFSSTAADCPAPDRDPPGYTATRRRTRRWRPSSAIVRRSALLRTWTGAGCCWRYLNRPGRPRWPATRRDLVGVEEDGVLRRAAIRSVRMAFEAPADQEAIIADHRGRRAALDAISGQLRARQRRTPQAPRRRVRRTRDLRP